MSSSINCIQFTEVIAYFLEHPKYWKAIQDLATQDTPAADEKLKRWVLEVQRIAVDLWIVRTPTKNDPNTSLHGTEGNGEDKKEVTRTVKKDDILVLKVVCPVPNPSRPIPPLKLSTLFGKRSHLNLPLY